MHCDCCDALLADVEQTIIFTNSGEQANTCLKCLSTMDVKYKLPYEDTGDYVEVDGYMFLEEEPPLYTDDELWQDS